MNSSRFVSLFVILISVQALAQSNRAFLGNQTNGPMVVRESNQGTPQMLSMAGHEARHRRQPLACQTPRQRRG
jgi:hypothetical protein